MNYVYMIIEILLVYLLLVIFYKLSKKEGLFQYILFMASILSIIMYKLITVMSFQINMGIPIVVGIFICSNIIIQRFGEDEIGKIIKYFSWGYVGAFIIINLIGVISPSEYNLVGNVAFNSLFGYNLDVLRIYIGGFIAISFMLWYNGYLYYYFRKSHNKLIFSNIGSILIIQFVESIIFVIISYSFSFDLLQIFGMIVVRYLIKVIIGVIGLIPVYMIVKIADK